MTRVEVTLDGGESWLLCALGRRPGAGERNPWGNRGRAIRVAGTGAPPPLPAVREPAGGSDLIFPVSLIFLASSTRMVRAVRAGTGGPVGIRRATSRRWFSRSIAMTTSRGRWQVRSEGHEGRGRHCCCCGRERGIRIW